MPIYKITNKVNNKMYVGQTIRDLKDRYEGHLYRAFINNSNTKLYNAMRKYGKENFEIEIIDNCSDSKLNERETYWINKLDTYNNGYNMTLGGEDNPMNNEEIIERHKIKMQSKEVREKISKSLSNYIKEHGFSEEHKRRLSESAMGNKNFLGHKRSEYAKSVTLKALHKDVYCISEDGAFIKQFYTVREASEWFHKYVFEKFGRKECPSIKGSSRSDKFVYGLKWIYGVPCVETTEKVAVN